MRLLALALMSTTTLFVGTASAAVGFGSQSDMDQLTIASTADEVMLAKGRRGDDIGGDDQLGKDDILLAKGRRGDDVGGDDQPGKDDILLAKGRRGDDVGGDNQPGKDDILVVG